MPLDVVSQSRCFNGTQFTYQHQSSAISLKAGLRARKPLAAMGATPATTMQRVHSTHIRAGQTLCDRLIGRTAESGLARCRRILSVRVWFCW
jgi:hypothetical protein